MSKVKFELQETIRVGIIQTDIDQKVAWNDAESGIFEMD